MLVTQKLENNKRTCTISIVICPWVSPQSRYSLFKRLLRGHDSLRGCWNIVKNIRMRKRTHNIYLSRLCLRVQYWPQSGLSTVMYGLKKTNSTKFSLLNEFLQQRVHTHFLLHYLLFFLFSDHCASHKCIHIYFSLNHSRSPFSYFTDWH